VNKPTLQTQVTAMKKYNWEDLTDEDIRDEITLVELVMKVTQTDPKLTDKHKQNVIDDCLDNLNLIYNEQRKRGTFKSDFRTT
jgi:hypothetical protein